MWSLLFSVAMAAPGLTGGSVYQAVPVSGQVVITCQNESQTITRNFICYQNLLVPGDYDFFEGQPGIKADQVSLKVTHQDGSIKMKSSPYDEKRARSKNRFNLWVRSLTQTPLLALGRNQIDYSVSKAGIETDHGFFDVVVEQGPARTCVDRGLYSSPVLTDCDGSRAICARYFSERNNCLSTESSGN